VAVMYPSANVPSAENQENPYIYSEYRHWRRTTSYC
jgi:hypothetical protein